MGDASNGYIIPNTKSQTAGAYLAIDPSGGNELIWTNPAAGGSSMWTGFANGIYYGDVTNGSQVGIGCTNPQTRLELFGYIDNNNSSNNIDPFMIHFNYLIGHVKKEKMIEFNEWYNN